MMSDSNRASEPAAPANSFIGRLGGWFNLPRAAWVRVGLLLVVMAAAKCGVVFALRKELYQVHWRIDAEPPTWLNWAAFYLFAVVAGASLWMFGQRVTATNDLRASRKALGVVTVLALLFLVLTFHEGNRNYLFAVMNGVLTWQQLGAYFQLRFFFGPPYLAAWLAGAAFVYYVLLRTGREKHVWKVFALAATVYVAVFLRHLWLFQAELFALDAVGLACLVAGWRARGTIRWPLAFAPLALMAVAFVILRGLDAQIALPRPEFIVLAGSGVVLFAGGSLLARRGGFSSGWSWLVPFASASFVLLMAANYPLAENYRNLLVLGLVLPRYLAGSAVLIAGVLLCAALYRRLRPRGSWLWLDFVVLGLSVLAIVDLRLTQIMEVRLDWQVLAFADSPKMMWRMAKPYLPLVGVALAVLVSAYFWGLRFLLRPGSSEIAPVRAVRLHGEYVLIAALLLGLAGIAFVAPDKGRGEPTLSLIKSSPLWRRFSEPRYSREEFVSRAESLGLGHMLRPQTATPAGPPRDLNVVLIFQESVYNQHLSLFGCTNNTQPLLSAYTNRMELFPHFYSNFAGSIHARFATFAGLYPVRDFTSFTRNRVPVRTIFEVLKDHGYETSMFYSSFLDYTNFRDLLQAHGVQRMFDADTMPGTRKTQPVSWGLKEEETLGAILDDIKGHAATRQKFFLTYVPAAPHNPFDGIPREFQKFAVTDVDDFTSRYQNELLYMDWVISRILGQLEKSGLLDQTLVVITSDHGELLGANGGPIGHGWMMTPELANVPLIVLDPGKPGFQINPAIGSQVDLLPTIVQALRLPLPDGELYQGLSLYGDGTNVVRRTYLNSFRQFATIEGKTIFVGDRDLKSPASSSAYGIAGAGSQPIFVPAPGQARPGKIADFDVFQENFLSHYRDYANELRGAPLP